MVLSQQRRVTKIINILELLVKWFCIFTFSFKCEEHLIKFNDIHNTVMPAILIKLMKHDDLNQNIAVELLVQGS